VLRLLPYSEVAKVLACTEGAVRVRVHRCLLRLRKHSSDDPFPLASERL
jgi:DNA-directed RNA polymerase specialized sigma24 family protein